MTLNSTTSITGTASAACLTACDKVTCPGHRMMNPQDIYMHLQTVGRHHKYIDWRQKGPLELEYSWHDYLVYRVYWGEAE